MPLIKFDHVISCSSEDPNHPAENLVNNDPAKKWKCSSWEKSVSVVLQLDRAVVINSIDIGNEHSAFIEVLVGRSSSPDEPFQVLLVASSFMSPMEARNGTMGTRVRMFSSEQLRKPVVEKRWDRVKVICSQPFNKHVQYGLAFISLHSTESAHRAEGTEHITTKIGKFPLRQDDDDTDVMSVGSLFSKRKRVLSQETETADDLEKKPELVPHKDNATAKNNLDVKVKRVEGPLRISSSAKQQSTTIPSAKQQSTTTPSARQQSTTTPSAKQQSTTTPSARQQSTTTPSAKQQSTTTPSAKRQSFNENSFSAKQVMERPQRKLFSKLLEGVVFVLSGYQNPHRAQIRAKALEMGAKYKTDWSLGCTHLICAFSNTPKFQQVRGRGHIVTKEWIEHCYSRRRRLPWRRYALDQRDKGPESEEEILELLPSSDVGLENCTRSYERTADSPGVKEHTVNNSGSEECTSDIPYVKERTASVQERTADSSDSDTEDEIERVRTAQKDDSYSGDTDVETTNEVIQDNTPLPPSPHILQQDNVPPLCGSGLGLRARLHRYIVAFKGKVSPDIDSKVDFVVSNSRNAVEEGQSVRVSPQWVWDCCDKEQLLSTQDVADNKLQI